MNETDLKKKLTDLWGGLTKPINVDPKLRLINHLDFDELNDEALVSLLDILLKSSGSSGSGFSVDLDNYDILDFMRQRLYQVKATSRRLMPTLRCYDAFAGRNTGPNEGQWSLAVMFLISSLESYFRENNPYTDAGGVVVQQLPQTLSFQKNTGNRVNLIGQALELYLYSSPSKFAEYLCGFDAEVIRYVNDLIKRNNLHNVIDGVVVPANYVHTSLVERLNSTRNAVMHGERQAGHDMFLFLTLHSIMFVYDQNLFAKY